MAKIKKSIELSNDELLDLICDKYHLKVDGSQIVFLLPVNFCIDPPISIKDVISILIVGDDRGQPIFPPGNK